MTGYRLVIASSGACALAACGPQPSSNAAAAAPDLGISEMEALALRQYNLKRAPRDPDKAVVPYVENMGRGSEAYFAWGASTKHARMRNGLGIEVAVSASCIVDLRAKRITSLTLNGETLI